MSIDTWFWLLILPVTSLIKECEGETEPIWPNLRVAWFALC